ncbi:gluconate kinase [Ilyomonas limi]|uniref:Gluconate kinase n=1 Tax=Ilyomonas limi TaxID=2575867 RepID=A0A4U3L0H2_9BACT|nr:gluconokinase [Ilyomonas limi]TKK66966.1 gluconate kinase [Ilyomonas limi]
MSYLLAIDIGTTHCKAITFDTQCKAVHSLKATYETINDEPGQNEQNPDEILQQVATLITQSLQANTTIQGVCFSAAMHSIIAVNKEGKPLTNAIIWADTRSSKQAVNLRNSDTGTIIYQKTGTPIHPMSPLCKLLWMKEVMPQIFSEAYKFISIKEYIFYKLFGKYIIDHSIASATGLFDIHTLAWCNEALEVAGIAADKLSTPVVITHIEKALTSTGKQLLKAENDIAFIIGGNDGCLANLGCGAIHPGDAALTIGTSGAVRTTCTTKQTDDTQRLFSYLLTDDMIITGGAINNGGVVLEWFGKMMADNDKTADFNYWLQQAATAPAGADKLLFLPYILGERAPMWDADVKGVFFGLSSQHTQQHLARAVIEGICFAMRNVVAAIEDTSGNISNLYASGGFIQSPFWLQLLTDILGKRISINNSADASAAGAAIIGLYALGFIKNLNDSAQFFKTEKVYEPQEKGRRQYDALFTIFQSLYPKLKDEFHALSKLK